MQYIRTLTVMYPGKVFFYVYLQFIFFVLALNVKYGMHLCWSVPVLLSFLALANQKVNNSLPLKIIRKKIFCKVINKDRFNLVWRNREYLVICEDFFRSQGIFIKSFQLISKCKTEHFLNVAKNAKNTLK